MTDVSKLDAMLNALRDKPAAKRARRKGVELQVFVDAQGRYTITANGKPVEHGMETREGHAMLQASERADALRALGKQVTVTLI
jgi:hypothetical protein